MLHHGTLALFLTRVALNARCVDTANHDPHNGHSVSFCLSWNKFMNVVPQIQVQSILISLFAWFHHACLGKRKTVDTFSTPSPVVKALNVLSDCLMVVVLSLESVVKALAFLACSSADVLWWISRANWSSCRSKGRESCCLSSSSDQPNTH